MRYNGLETCRTAPMPGVVLLRNHAGRAPLSLFVRLDVAGFRGRAQRQTCHNAIAETIAAT